MSRYQFNSESKTYEKNTQSTLASIDLFEEGNIPYLPRDCILKPEELLGYVNTAPEIDSELEDSDEEDMTYS